MGAFAVIDTETNWADRVMSIGCCIADRDTFQLQAMQYHILTPECQTGGMYAHVLFLDTPVKPNVCSRREAMQALLGCFAKYGVTSLYAYNARFDRNHLPELEGLSWYDILRLAAYRQYNPRIPVGADCCSTGRLKRDYGVESMLRLLSGNQTYRETHNALYDALDELEIMRLLGHRPEAYIRL